MLTTQVTLTNQHEAHVVEEPIAEAFEDLTDAASSSLDFWSNPFDDEDWNNA